MIDGALKNPRGEFTIEYRLCISFLRLPCAGFFDVLIIARTGFVGDACNFWWVRRRVLIRPVKFKQFT